MIGIGTPISQRQPERIGTSCTTGEATYESRIAFPFNTMNKPVRLTLSRKRGFRLQPLSKRTNGLEAVVVARPSKWGNPFTLARYGRAEAIARYRAWLRDESGLDPRELAGKNLACWCKPDQECHADVLLKAANKRQAAARRPNAGGQR